MSLSSLLLRYVALYWWMFGLVRSFEQQRYGQNRYIVQRYLNEAAHDVVPLVVILGTAQTADAWSFHLPALSNHQGRSVLLYEPIGLGPYFDAKTEPDVSLPAQSRRLQEIVEHVFGSDKVDEIDLAGFSLGGRIAMAVAADTAVSNRSSNDLSIRKLHLTGVALQRSQEGLRELDKWRDLLRNDDLPGFAEAAIRMSYSQVPQHLDPWIKAVSTNHRAAGLLALLEQAHDETGSYSVGNLADRLQCQSGRLVVGTQDRMAPPDFAGELARRLGWPEPLLIEGAHAIPLESPRVWRMDVLEFLKEG